MVKRLLVIWLLANFVLLRHLPADIYYARLWHATPSMWLARQLQLYIGASFLGLARHLGRSTYAAAIMHILLFTVALFG